MKREKSLITRIRDLNADGAGVNSANTQDNCVSIRSYRPKHSIVALDIGTRNLNQKILSLLKLNPDNFPEIKEAAGISYNLTQEITDRFGLKERIPVYLCGNDQSASAAGAGIEGPGDISANFGTAMVLYTIIKEPLDVTMISQITGINPLTNDYFLICYESEFGNVIDKFKTCYFPDGTGVAGICISNLSNMG